MQSPLTQNCEFVKVVSHVFTKFSSRPILQRNLFVLHRSFVSIAEVAGVTFSDSDSALVPKFLNPDPGSDIFQF